MIPDRVTTHSPDGVKTTPTGGARYAVLCLAWAGCLLITNTGTAFAEIADSGTLNFSGTLESGTCSLTLSQTPLALGPVDPTSIVSGGDWATAGEKAFDVVLSGCTGVGGGMLAPLVHMTGALLTNGGSVTSNTNLFKSGGASKGFGVLIFSTAGGDEMLADQQWISIAGHGPGTTLPIGDIKIPLKAKVSAGLKAWQGASGVNLQGGDLTAAVTFTFEYH